MAGRGLRWTMFALVAVLLGCAPARAPGTAAIPGETTSAPSRPLVIATRVEPITLSAKELRASGVTGDYRRALFNAGLAYADEREVFQPYLAEALPQLETDTWRVSPDGRMETIYRLRPNLTWHDGAPLVASDWVFALRIFLAPEFGIAASLPQREIAEIVAPDPRTVVVRWKRPFPNADGLTAADLQPLPQHLLEGPLDRGDAESFLSHPFWSRDYVGSGPFRLTGWEAGSYVEAEAFNGHALGRPRIDRLRIIFTPDPNVALANLLAGAAHIAIDNTMRFQQGAILEGQWTGAQGGTVVKWAGTVRRSEVQMHPERATPRALTDVRVRRALSHAVDRDGLNQGLVDGQGSPAHTLVLPHVAHFAAVDRVLLKYPYDLRRTEQLMAEAGYSRGADGVYASPTAGRFALELRVLEGAQNEAELAIMTHGLQTAGFDMTSAVLAAGQVQDAQVRATFPGLQSTTGGDLETLTSNRIPSAENRWQGMNRSSWSHPEFDRLIETYNTTLARAERIPSFVQAARIYSEETPSISLYYNVQIMPHVAALQGPLPSSPWNIHQWELRN